MFKVIPESPNYSVNKNGEILNNVTGKKRTPQIHKNGYVRLDLYHNKKMTMRSIHRLVAEAFIPNPLNLPHVHHRDYNKQNNHVSNLAWSTIHDNVSDARAKHYVLINPQGKRVLVYGMNKFCANQDPVLHPYAIHQVLKGKRKHHKKWTAP